MKFWLLPCVLLLATSCSHSATNNAAPSDTAKAPEAAAGKAPSKPGIPGDKSAHAKKKSNDGPVGDHTACTSGSDERVIEITSKGEGCTVEYTKLKEKKEIASAEHETDHCKQVAQKIRGHLEAAGFTCN
jgi:hypothetical protein